MGDDAQCLATKDEWQGSPADTLSWRTLPASARIRFPDLGNASGLILFIEVQGNLNNHFQKLKGQRFNHA